MKVAIIGGRPSEPPYDSDWEIWVHGNQYDRHQEHRVTRIFEIHENLSEHDPKYPQWLAGQNIPLIVSDKFPVKGDHIKVFPKEANVLDKLTSTPAYMMALAIHEGATHIAIYGIDMGVDNHEYFKQRPGMYAWIGYAKGLGIEVTIESNTLFKDPYDEGRDWNNSKTFSEASFKEMIDLHQKKIEEYTMLVHTHSGSLQTYQRLAKVARALESGQDVKLTDSMVIK